MAGKKKKRRTRVAADEPVAVESTGEAEEAPVEASGEWTVGAAIEAVRTALEPFDEATRRKVIRAATSFLM